MPSLYGPTIRTIQKLILDSLTTTLQGDALELELTHILDTLNAIPQVGACESATEETQEIDYAEPRLRVPSRAQ